MQIQTGRLIIRSLRPSDEGAFVEMASDGSLTEIFEDCSRCREWMGGWIRESLQLEAEDNPRHAYLAFAVEEKAGGQVVGSVGSSYYEDLERVGVTYFIGAPFRGRRYMAEALRAFSRYFFERYDEDALFATAAAANAASCRTLERAGFTRFDTRVYQDLFDGEPALSHFYELKRDARP